MSPIVCNTTEQKQKITLIDNFIVQFDCKKQKKCLNSC